MHRKKKAAEDSSFNRPIVFIALRQMRYFEMSPLES
jgi:hypothetical protein